MESLASFLTSLRARRCATFRGFTLIELLVVLGIIAVLSTIVVTTQSSFNKTLILTNAAYDVALTIRSAQTYGLGNRAVGVSTNIGYGIHFSSATPNSFVLFADSYPSPNDSTCHGLPSQGASAPDAKPGNCVFDTNQGETVTDYTLGNRVAVSDFCAHIGGSWICAVGGEGVPSGLTSLDIVFSRPNSDTQMTVNGAYDPNLLVTSACVKLVSGAGGSPRYLSVSSAGQITANAPTCP